MTPSSPKAPKLRTSCDECGTAKVKCDQRRPTCSRCSNLSVTCVYGPSRKHGKPPRKRLSSAVAASDINDQTGKRVCTGVSPTAARNRIPVGNSPDLDGSVQDVNARPFVSIGQNNVHSAASVDLLYTGNHSNPSLPAGEELASTSASHPSQAFGEWPQLEDWSQFENFRANGLLDFPSTPRIEHASSVSKSLDNSKPHSCPRESYEIFRDLICPSPLLHVPDSNVVTVSAQLDQVLQFNRNATERLTQVLSCPCAKSGHRAMVHASIISRILIWYQQAAGWTGSTSWGLQPSASLESSTQSSSLSPTRISSDTTSVTDSPSLVQATGFSVEHVPLSIGAFKIDDQNMQAVFRNQLVLSELTKTAALISLFISQDNGKSSSGEKTSLYSHLGTWLQSEHLEIVQTLKNRLRTLNGNLCS